MKAKDVMDLISEVADAEAFRVDSPLSYDYRLVSSAITELVAERDARASELETQYEHNRRLNKENEELRRAIAWITQFDWDEVSSVGFAEAMERARSAASIKGEQP